jgi:hypothetical protein
LRTQKGNLPNSAWRRSTAFRKKRWIGLTGRQHYA